MERLLRLDQAGLADQRVERIGRPRVAEHIEHRPHRRHPGAHHADEWRHIHPGVGGIDLGHHVDHGRRDRRQRQRVGIGPVLPVEAGKRRVARLVLEQHQEIELLAHTPILQRRAGRDPVNDTAEQSRLALVEPAIGVHLGAQRDVLPAGRIKLVPDLEKADRTGRHEGAEVGVAQRFQRDPVGAQAGEPVRRHRHSGRCGPQGAVVGAAAAPRIRLDEEQVSDVEVRGKFGIECHPAQRVERGNHVVVIRGQRSEAARLGPERGLVDLGHQHPDIA
ncbi:hypothetical protein D3C86_1107240 [compost metagenome]